MLSKIAPNLQQNTDLSLTINVIASRHDIKHQPFVTNFLSDTLFIQSFAPARFTPWWPKNKKTISSRVYGRYTSASLKLQSYTIDCTPFYLFTRGEQCNVLGILKIFVLISVISIRSLFISQFAVLQAKVSGSHGEGYFHFFFLFS